MLLLRGLRRTTEILKRMRMINFAAIVCGIALMGSSVLAVPTFAAGIITHGDTSEKLVALTFDADMTPHMKKMQSKSVRPLWYDERVFTALESAHAKSTVFATGMWPEVYSARFLQLATNPLYEIENHSYDHAAFTQHCYGLPRATDKRDEIVHANKIITELTGRKPHYFRFPGGCSAPDDVAAVHELGMDAVGWNVISGDAFSKNQEYIVHTVLSKVRPGSIVVFHLGGMHAPATARALPQILSELKRRGYTFVTVRDLLTLGPTVN